MKTLKTYLAAAIVMTSLATVSCKEETKADNETTVQTTATETDTITQTAAETPGVTTDTVNADRDPVAP